MITHLKPLQEYVDRYDRLTVEDCRSREGFHNKIVEKPKDKIHEISLGLVRDVSLYFDMLYATLKWYDEKEATISKWMDADQKKDALLEHAQPPEGVCCLKCYSLTTCSDKSLHDWGNDARDRVLFFFTCPSGCLPHRAFFDDGEEYRIKLDLCPKCETELDTKSERIKDKKIVTMFTCSKCGYTKTEELNLTAEKEKPDPDYLKDRARFCLTKEEADKKRDEKWRAVEMGKLVDRMKEDRKHDKEREAVAKLTKLNVVELEKMLVPICEEAGYIKFQFGTPDMGKDLILPLTVHDSKSDRVDRFSSHALDKLLKNALKNTNWRLMSDGTSYRLGILSGRLKAYEREEDLFKLVENDK
jgi:hypothetical protein